MSPLTIFLARLTGLYCVIIALGMAANRRAALAAVDGFLNSPALTLLASFIAVGIGLAMALGHTIWSGGALPVVVTLVGWTILAKGCALLLLPPDRALKFYQALGYEKHFHLYMAGTLLLGLYLAIAGFCA